MTIATAGKIAAQAVVATKTVYVYPTAIAVNTLTGRVYVASFGADYGDIGHLAIIDGDVNGIRTQLEVGRSPVAVAVNPQTNKIYVVNQCGTGADCFFNNGTVSVIDGSFETVTATITVGYEPFGIAINPVTNKIYVGNWCSDPDCNGTGTVTEIDGNTNSTTTIPTGYYTDLVAVNPQTNKIYADNQCGNTYNCRLDIPATVTVIDGVTHDTTTLTAGIFPNAIALNPATNKVYLANRCGNDPNCSSLGTVTVIDGASNNTATVSVGATPYDVAVNSVTNKIYVANRCGDTRNCGRGSVTIIDGGTNSTSSVGVGYFPQALAVNSNLNKIYVANSCGNDSSCHNAGTVTVIDGITHNTLPMAVGTTPIAIAANPGNTKIYTGNYTDHTVSMAVGDRGLQFIPITPCRVADTRGPVDYTLGGPAIAGGTSRSFPLTIGDCGIPHTVAAYSLNVSVVPNGPLGYLTVWPSGEQQPLISTLNSPDGRVKGVAAIVQAGVGSQSVRVYASNTTNVIIDVNGYFIPADNTTLAFYPLPPCRVFDTRDPNGPLGGPYISGGSQRDFPVLQSDCNIPNNAQAYSLNLAVTPVVQGHGLGYLTAWPTGQPRPVVSTINNPTATVVANAAIVPAGTAGEISVYATDNTQLIADINGYFAAPAQGGLSLYPAVPCRVIDTRQSGTHFSGTLAPPVNVQNSVCGPAANAQAYIFSASVVPSPALNYLTLWPDGQPRPTDVSTLNAPDGKVTSNMAIVGNQDGKTGAYASGNTYLILDLSSYFAP